MCRSHLYYGFRFCNTPFPPWHHLKTNGIPWHSRTKHLKVCQKSVINGKGVTSPGSPKRCFILKLFRKIKFIYLTFLTGLTRQGFRLKLSCKSIRIDPWWEYIKNFRFFAVNICHFMSLTIIVYPFRWIFIL
jgi:hypothetical protein